MTISAMLTLDGEPIAMSSMRISLSMQFQDKDQSGQTSATSKAEQGAKAKELDVSGLIPYKDQDKLARLFELADLKGDGGQRHVFRVGSLLAKAVKIRQAKFTGRITASEQEGLLAWQVSFTLSDHNSVPEKREQRLPKAAQVSQATEQTTQAKAPSSSEDGKADEDALTPFERYLKKVDDALA
ncbi:baseplate complex protein [Aeromonas bivalvium]|uniref:baseplate complex protein n=1 Tax=Aeromonas bivalvium TaxID=440079 RepID=UPI0038D1E2F7